MNGYQVTQTVPTVYLNKRQQAVNGYVVYIFLPEFDETHELRLPDISQAMVKAGAEKLLEERRLLAKLGHE